MVVSALLGKNTFGVMINFMCFKKLATEKISGIMDAPGGNVR